MLGCIQYIPLFLLSGRFLTPVMVLADDHEDAAVLARGAPGGVAEVATAAFLTLLPGLLPSGHLRLTLLARSKYCTHSDAPVIRCWIRRTALSIVGSIIA